jgi:hypothetical protein
MEYGTISNINQFKDNNSLEIQKVQASSATSVVGERTQVEKNIKDDEIVKLRESFSSSEVSNDLSTSPQYEVTLTNTNFGFNDSSRDFYVRAIRGDTENQYPTEDMMKLKSYLMNLEEQSA